MMTSRLILYKSFDPKDRLRHSNIYQRDKDGHKTKMESTLYDETGKCFEMMTVLYKYDNVGNLIWMKVLNDQHGYEEHIYAYDDSNRIISEKVRSSRHDNYDCVYIYSKSMVIKKYSSGVIGVTSYNGEEIYKSYASNGTLNDIIISRYDKFGNIICKKSVYFHCDCTGVYENPRDLEGIKYEYFK